MIVEAFRQLGPLDAFQLQLVVAAGGERARLAAFALEHSEAWRAELACRAHTADLVRRGTIRA